MSHFLDMWPRCSKNNVKNDLINQTKLFKFHQKSDQEDTRFVPEIVLLGHSSDPSLFCMSYLALYYN